MSTVLAESFANRLREFPSPLAGRSWNKLLASLPREDYQRIALHLQRVPMREKEMVYRQDALMRGVYFPGGGVCALVKTTQDGQTAEIATVGAEGAIGASVFCGLHHAPCDVIVQMAGPPADVMPAHLFEREMERRGVLYDRLVRYRQAFLVQIIQSGICNRLHTAHERCARWLLATHDRAGNDEFRFTHESVAVMLSLRRPTVTLVAGSLHAAGLIEQRRGSVRILNRAGLEAVSCECYRSVRAAFSHLLPECGVSYSNTE